MEKREIELLMEKLAEQRKQIEASPEYARKFLEQLGLLTPVNERSTGAFVNLYPL